MIKLIFANSQDSNMFYAVKIYVPDPFFYLETENKKYAFIDHREYGIFVEKNKIPNLEPVLLNPLLDEIKSIPDDTGAANKLALLILEKYGKGKKEITVPFNFPFGLAEFLQKKGFNIQIKSPFWEERIIKTAEEIANIDIALQKTFQAFEKIEEILKDSEIRGEEVFYQGNILTSEILKAEAEKTLVDNGLADLEGMIVSCGRDASMPHNQGSGPIMANQPIICDIFPKDRKTGYCADMTRTYVKGEPSEEFKKLYAAVKKAQESAIAIIKPGLPAKAVYDKACESFLEDGYDVGDAGFVHGFGHGLGLDVHEPPYVNRSTTDILAPGQIITAEPGLYYENLGGVRIEDLIVVTEDGYQNLTNYHKEYIIP